MHSPPPIREYKHFYKHMFQIRSAHAKKKKKKKKKAPTVPRSHAHLQEHSSLTFAKLPFAFNPYLSLTCFLKPPPTLSREMNLFEEGVRGSGAGPFRSYGDIWTSHDSKKQMCNLIAFGLMR